MTSATEADRDGRRPAQSFARGGLLNMVGAAVSGVFTFVLVWVLARRVGQEEVGDFMVGVAALSIVAQAAQLGANTGFVRFIPALSAGGRDDLVRSLIPRVFAVVALAGMGAGWVMHRSASALASSLGAGDAASGAVEYIRMMSFVVPFATLFMVAAQCTQAFGDMTPAVAIDKIGRPTLQVVLVGLAAGAGTTAVAVSYGVVYPVGALVLIAVIYRLLPPRDSLSLGHHPSAPIGGFWRFSLPRSLSTTFQVTILWADTILIGFLRSSEEAAVYSVATRYLVVGNLVVGALLQAMGPRLARHLATADLAAARRLYQRSATWVVGIVWPAYVVIALYSPWLLQIFGDGYVEGASALRIVAIAMMVSGACGGVDSVLLMSGRSWLSVGNWGAGLVVNLALNLLLIPRMGIEGAAIAWAVSILVRNVVPVLQIKVLYGMSPTTPTYWRLAVGALAIVGVPSLISAMVVTPGLPTFAFVAAPSLCVYAALALGLFRRERSTVAE